MSKEIKKIQGLVEIDLRNGQRERIEKWLRAIHSVRTENIKISDPPSLYVERQKRMHQKIIPYKSY